MGYETTQGGTPEHPSAWPRSAKTSRPTRRRRARENGDFSKAIAKHFNGISPEERPWVFVVKKQKTVLTELLRVDLKRVADTPHLLPYSLPLQHPIPDGGTGGS